MNGLYPWFLRLEHIAFDPSSFKDMSFLAIPFPTPPWQSPTFLYTLLILLSDHKHTTLLINYIKQLLSSSTFRVIFIFQTPDSLPTKLHFHVLLATQSWVITTYFICGFVYFWNLKVAEPKQQDKQRKKLITLRGASTEVWSVFDCASGHLPIHAHFWSLYLSLSFGVHPGKEGLLTWMNKYLS